MTTRHTGCRFARHLENIPQVSVKEESRYYRIDTIQLESNESSQQMATVIPSSPPVRIVNARLNICLLVQIDIRYDRSSFAVTSRSIRVESCRIVNIFYTAWFRNSDKRLAVVSLSKNVGGPCLPPQIDIRYDGSSFAVTSSSIRIKSSRFVNIFYSVWFRKF